MHYNNNGHIDELVFLLIMYLKDSVKTIVLRESLCGIPKVVVKVCPFVSLFSYLQCHIFQDYIHNF